MNPRGVPKLNSSQSCRGSVNAPSHRRARLTLAAATLLPVIIGLALLPGASASAAEGVPGLPGLEERALVADVTPGDLDCDGGIDVVDAVLILRRVASLSTVSGCGTGDVNCSGAIDAIDALALLRDMARLPPLPVPAGCPGVDRGKVTPFVAIDRLECAPATIAPGQATDCYYSVGSSGADHELSWDFDGGIATQALPAVLGLSCPPDNLPCTFATAGTQSLTFQDPGDKLITLTACAMGSCDSKTVIVAVAAAGSG